MEFYAGSPLVLYVWIYLIHYVASYDQLVNTTKTKVESSSTYTYGTYSGSADKTIDKNFDQDYRNCMHTAPGRKRAWLRIDLGDYFNLKSVKIWYRSDKNRRTDHNTKRLKGFSIFASYTPNVDKKYICYQDPGNKTLHTVLEVDCTRIARYVTIFNDKINDPVGVFLEICEVEIYGCPRHEYGEKCARCDMCKYECDITGRCDTQGCKEGYLPPFCKVCSPGRYGEDCKGVCGHCERNEACPNINESCPGLCKPRYYMEKCPTRQLVNPTFTLANSSSVGYRGYPNKTVDGNFSQSHYLHCMHTSGIGTEAWLRINLRKIYNISSVKFWYRNDRKYPESPNTRRIQGYNIRLSNTTQIKHQDVCFQHTGNETLPPIIENKCEGVAQYVWIYTNKSFHDGVFLEICEVQIFGCSYQENGGKCVPCDQCKNDCKENGECDEHGCKMDGYLPPYCKKCKRRRFGKDCNSTCGHCANNIPCDDVTGSCPDGNCSPGWKHTTDRKCDQKCDNGYFGMECRSNCSGHCAGGIPCNKINGYCLGGCADGWINSYCNGTCKENFYGRSCSILCGHCANSAKCDHVTGSCPSGHCEPGYKYNEKKCDEECDDGTFGYHCRETCSGHCAGKVPCNKANGYCPGRCADGWINLFCNESCKNGFYGKNCSLPCGHCLNNTKCDHVTGSCPSGHCELGWKNTYGRKCDEECDNGTFGYHCRETCSGHCAGKVPCNKANGYCPGRCADGWINLFCNESCKSKSYGKNCSFACGHCEYNANCDHVTGFCPSGRCEPGYKHNEKKCNEECDDGTFGYYCRENCSGNCAGKVPCNKTDGTCPGGCADGWQNPDCNEKCDVEFYGKDCQENCGHCGGSQTCHHINGSCFGLCKPGYQGEKCKRECDMGFYGKDCKEKCGHCRGVVTCHHINGSCHGLCESGYQGDKCYTVCDNGTFGLYCRYNCSGHCSGGSPCSKVDGLCLRGCDDGWRNSYCNETCEKGFYGRNCTIPCGQCAKYATCHHVTGSCPNGYCEPGWQNTPHKRCNKECDNGTFGHHCMNNCSGHCKRGLPCKKDDGNCIEGCADGWTNKKCNETCSRGFYGKGCQEICGKCGGTDTCHHVSGSCPRFCAPGYKTEKCDIECDNGTFGFRCNFTCTESCLSICNKINGTCDNCQYGFVGEFCNITVAEAQVQDLTPAAAGAGVFLLILIIAIIVLVVVLARKSRKKKADAIELPERKDLSNNDSQENNPEDKGNKTENGLHREENADIEYIATDNSQKKTLIKISDLGKIIKAFSLEENKKFTEEFKGIPYGEQQHIPCAVAKLQQNMPRNRYKTTFPYDHSRVVLNVCPENDYINANYIKDVEGKQRYIATQGPRKNTVQDFWAMIWQENIYVIVMVTKLIEGSKIKCEQYWPGQGDQMTSGQFCLQLMSQKDYANYTQRVINITNKKTNVVKTVIQVQFMAWPDHGTPSPIELLVFYRHVMRLRQRYPESLLAVHCSAGIGRTGTFIALDALYKHGLKEGNIDVVEYVKIMREDRMNMIQNADQYVFLYKALFEIFKTNGRLLKKEQFIQEVTSQLMSDKAANASQFKKEFNELLSIRPEIDVKDTTDARENINLNMTKTVLPAESVRVLLTSYVRGRGSYYNAVSISSYTLREGLIAAQYPVEGAGVDLVRLLIDHNCSILVSVNQLSDIASSSEWFTTSPEKSSISPYKTKISAVQSLSNKLKMTFLKMKHDKDSEWHNVKMLEILNWKGNEKLPSEEEVLVELLNKVQEIVKDPETKIAVLSRDGATGCGIFCAVYNAIQQLQQDNEVDMFTIIRQLQMRRPEMVSTMSEYQCCCQVVANFFTAQKDDIYENAQGQQGVTKTEENIYANTNS
ncbi:uncharacterized protein LOC133189382 isoform X1 [Saccostrea echinata]|uniref:uncharacterized protein LOC133189382 isoform X1 n=1 Tax=Saccostrea echinata TaxID=191078 RepID=UPI002A816049|nr:uncharacterized protein LOC133189382 isoform X1 [Saccostrea echinata]